MTEERREGWQSRRGERDDRGEERRGGWQRRGEERGMTEEFRERDDRGEERGMTEERRGG